MMTCRGCGHEEATRTFTRIDIGGTLTESCDRCSKISGSSVPDVYWPGNAHFNPMLTDDKGSPIWLESRRHKAEVMRKQGLREAGDFHRGHRIGADAHQQTGGTFLRRK